MNCSSKKKEGTKTSAGYKPRLSKKKGSKPPEYEAKDEVEFLDTSPENFGPFNGFVTPILTDLYQLTMAYSYFKLGKHTQTAVFEVFFRKAPFQGSFAVFCGLEDVLRFTNTFKFTKNQIAWLKTQKPTWTPDFWAYLENLDCSALTIDALEEGTVCFPRVPMLRLKGPLGLVQLLETTVLNSVNYATLVATNAARHRLVVGDKPKLFEFGLRRAQGPDGGMSAARYTYIGGYTGSSNVAAAKAYGVPITGTQAHSYVTSFEPEDQIPESRRKLAKNPGVKGAQNIDIVDRVAHWRAKLDPEGKTHTGELVAFTAYAIDFANGFLALIDTYDTMKSGLVNYAIVAMALKEAGYTALGIRIDSGDLGAQSFEIKKYFEKLDKKFKQKLFSSMAIVASNDINEDALEELKDTAVSGYGVGTHLVTCKGNPALGGVYKLVELNGKPRVKLSADRFKTTIAGGKQCYRIYDKSGAMLCDVLTHAEEKEAPEQGSKFTAMKWMKGGQGVLVHASRVQPLLQPAWANGRVVAKLPKIADLRERVQRNIWQIPTALRGRNLTEKYQVLLHPKLHSATMKLINSASGAVSGKPSRKFETRTVLDSDPEDKSCVLGKMFSKAGRQAPRLPRLIKQLSGVLTRGSPPRQVSESLSPANGSV